MPIGRLAPRSRSNLLGGSCALPRGHLAALHPQLRRADRMLPERRLDGRPHPRGRGPPRSAARRVRAGRPKAAQVMNLHQTKGRSRRHCSAAPIRRVPRPLGRAVPHWVAHSVRLSDQSTRARAHRRARHHPGSPRPSAAIKFNQRLHRRAGLSAATSAASPRTDVQDLVVCRANASAAAAMWNSRHHRTTSGRRVGKCAPIWAPRTRYAPGS